MEYGSKLVCFKPLHGFRAPGGTVKFSRSGAWRDRPITVSCGQCRGCRLEYSRQWAVRCVHESKMHAENCFITLTYKDEKLPNDGSLNVNHWQNFAKRLRKTHPFRFYHCGEYGSINHRPHYHAAIFGQNFARDRKFAKKTKQGNSLFTSPTLDRAWPDGNHWIAELNFQTASYVAGYIMKKVNGEQAIPHYGNLKPEYATMSRKPGIGSTWIEKFVDDVYPSDQVISNGKPARPPVFYDAYYKSINPEGFKIIQATRVREAEKHEKNNTPDRLEVRDEVLQHKQSLYEREL